MINKIILVGRLGKDPEKVDISGGHNLAKFSMATSETYKSGTEIKTETQWHQITCWQGRAEFALRHLEKGDMVYIEGKIKHRPWETEAGEKRYSTEVHANVLRRLSSRQRAEEDTKAGGSLGEVVVSEGIKSTVATPNDDLPF